LTYSAIDFERERLGDVLLKAGYEPQRRTLFIWEGVTYYLTAAAVDATLEFIRSSSPAGSRICFDYMINATDINDRYGVKETLESMKSNYSTECAQFSIEEGEISSFLAKRGYDVIDHLNAEEMEKKIPISSDGSAVGRVVALFCLVEAQVSDRAMNDY
jgi:methyltransferase (TIGR00027 family)